MKNKTSTAPGSKREDQIPGVEVKRPAPGAKVDPFAKKYNETEAGKGSFIPPKPGTYAARVTNAEGIVDGQKTSAFFEYTIVETNDPMEGKTCRQYFNFTDEDGNDGTGLPFFKSNMAMMGHDEELTSWDNMTDVLEEIAKEQIGVIIDVKKKGQYTNIYLSEVPEDQDSIPAV